ncbi:MAG: DNA alkylation repair protein [Ruminococcaceae bacterium]|nr:DNA alkylation repair protein [Oscillospiraceae bacterium]
MTKIQRYLFDNQDIKYRDFQAKLMPTVDKDTFIGVRTPILRATAKEVAKSESKDTFLAELPHRYFDEYQLHAFIISLEKDFTRCIEEVERLLPFIDNWATCDQLSPKVFKKHRDALRPRIDRWLVSEAEYAVRFGIKMVMEHFLDEDFDEGYMKKIAAIRSDKYYINMMAAWYFATALAKQYDTAVKYMENGSLDKWVHNKAIQKARESFRVSEEHKEYLTGLKQI